MPLIAFALVVSSFETVVATKFLSRFKAPHRAKFGPDYEPVDIDDPEVQAAALEAVELLQSQPDIQIQPGNHLELIRLIDAIAKNVGGMDYYMTLEAQEICSVSCNDLSVYFCHVQITVPPPGAYDPFLGLVQCTPHGPLGDN